MSNSISAISSASQSAGAGSSGTSITKLTAATKTELEALGVDTTNIKTEAQGQVALKAAKAKAKTAQKTQPSQGAESSIKAEVKTLAAQVGVSVSSNDKTSEILNKIAAKIIELKALAGTDKSKLSKVEEYQSKYDSLAQEVSSTEKSQSQLSASMNNMAMMNKIYLNLT